MHIHLLLRLLLEQFLKAGIIALGLEGYMVAGAFTGVVFVHYFEVLLSVL